MSQHLDKASPGARLDFLACNLMLHTDGGGLDKELEAFVGVSISNSSQPWCHSTSTKPLLVQGWIFWHVT